MAKKKFSESIQFGNTAKVDKEQSTIHGVKVIGRTSLNNRVYTEQALLKALPLYEGAKVYIDHSDKPRSYRDAFGKICNCRFQEDGIYGDLKFNPRHSVAEQLIYDAENDPSNVGLSHSATGRHVLKNGQQIVEEITKVHSVDLVLFPATTAGLFEQEETKENMELDELKSAVQALLDNQELDLAGLAKALCELAHPLVPAEEPAAEEPAADEPKADEAQEQVAALKQENVELKAELSAMKLKETIAAKKSKINQLITESKLPAGLATEELVESLIEMDESKALKLIETLKPLVSFQKPVSKSWHYEEQAKTCNSAAEFAKAIKG